MKGHPGDRRLRLAVTGRVQGVGFRPLVVRHARALGLRGFVQNGPCCVVIEVEGPAPESLVDRLTHAEPPVAVDGVTVVTRPLLAGEDGFSIRDSATGQQASPLVPPDLATCPDCWDEWAGSGRRAGYDLLSCTACGPRSSLLRALPFDRQRSEMDAFPLCAPCRAEVADPSDRRFHAQVTACPECGPKATGVLEAIAALKQGGIVALKGLSGFQLLCVAARRDAVDRLRALKHRPDKPLAVMLDLPVTPDCPVVIGPMVPGLSHLAPGLPWLGRLAPATPLHRRLLDACGPLVCTSGNRSGEAIAAHSRELAPLRAGLDGVLDHDRPILRTADDSVLRRSSPPILLRRGRGLHHPVPMGEGPTILAFGAHQKATLCLALGDRGIVTPYLGELSRRSVLQRYEAELARLLRLYGTPVDAVACDLHPDYVSTQLAQSLAREWGVPVHRVAHHEAHIAAVLAEHGHAGPALGFAWDGTGLGDDGLIRGSEALHWDGVGFSRVASLAPFSIAGDGTRSPRRCAEGWRDHPAWGTPTSSMGRLFDAAAWCCGIASDTTYEAAAALALEALAEPDAAAWRLPLVGGEWQHRHLFELLTDPQVPASVRAGRFHATLVGAIVALAEGVETVVLSGGCFQNALLLGAAVAALHKRGHRVLTACRMPPNDEAVSLGQAWLARRRS